MIGASETTARRLVSRIWPEYFACDRVWIRVSQTRSRTFVVHDSSPLCLPHSLAGRNIFLVENVCKICLHSCGGARIRPHPARRGDVQVPAVTKRSRTMGISRRDFVKLATSSGIALSFSRAAFAQAPELRCARDVAGTPELEPGRHRRGPHRRPGQGHRSQALRLRFSRDRSSRLAFEHVARLAHPSDGRGARLRRHRPLSAEGRPRTVAGGHRSGSRGRRHPRARVLSRAISSAPSERRRCIWASRWPC